MKTVFLILGAGVVLWWFVRPGSSGPRVLGGFIGDIIAFLRILTGQQVLTQPQTVSL